MPETHPNPPPSNPDVSGWRRGQRKLTTQQLTEARRLFSEGFSCAEIGRKFGLSRHTIARHARLQGWKSLRQSVRAVATRAVSEALHQVEREGVTELNRTVAEFLRKSLQGAGRIMGRAEEHVDRAETARELLHGAQAWAVGASHGRLALGIAEPGQRQDGRLQIQIGLLNTVAALDDREQVVRISGAGSALPLRSPQEATDTD